MAADGYGRLRTSNRLVPDGMDGYGLLWTGCVHLRIRRLGIRVPLGVPLRLLRGKSFVAHRPHCSDQVGAFLGAILCSDHLGQFGFGTVADPSPNRRVPDHHQRRSDLTGCIESLERAGPRQLNHGIASSALIRIPATDS